MENVLVLPHERFIALQRFKNELVLVLCANNAYICPRYVEVVDELTGEVL